MGSQPSTLSSSLTSLLYTGEQFDSGLQQYYLRARYYNQNNGRFNQLDPFGGSSFDPQSIHKYSYAHTDPINGADPSGRYTLTQVLIVVSVIAFLAFVTAGIIGYRNRFKATTRDAGASELLLNLYFSGTNVNELVQNMSRVKEPKWARNHVNRYLITCRGGVVDLVHVASSALKVIGGMSRQERLKQRFNDELHGGGIANRDDLPSDGFGALFGERIKNGTLAPAQAGWTFFNKLGMIEGVDAKSLAVRQKAVDRSLSLWASTYYSGKPFSIWGDLKAAYGDEPVPWTGNVTTTPTGDVLKDLQQAGFSLEEVDMGDQKVEFVK